MFIDVLVDNDVEYVVDLFKIKWVIFNVMNGLLIVGGDVLSDWIILVILVNGNFNLMYKNININVYEIIYFMKIMDFSDCKIKNEIIDENGVFVEVMIVI